VQLTSKSRLVVSLSSLRRWLPHGAPLGELGAELVDPCRVGGVDDHQSMRRAGGLAVAQEGLHRGVGRMKAKLGEVAEVVSDGASDLLVGVVEVLRVHLDVAGRPWTEVPSETLHRRADEGLLLRGGERLGRLGVDDERGEVVDERLIPTGVARVEDVLGTHLPRDLRFGGDALEDGRQERLEPIPDPSLLLQRPMLRAADHPCGEVKSAMREG